MNIIKQKNDIIAIIYRNSDWIRGLNFITPKDLYIQVSSWWYEKGKLLANHLHKEYSRETNRTHELVYIKKGKMKIFLFDNSKNKIGEVILEEGDLAVLVNGGHGYEILEDDTLIIEAKNGPFISVETDKEKF
ncbi:MAG: hypothetical protein QW303_05690 [Nitrososphaerota archaeon]